MKRLVLLVALGLTAPGCSEIERDVAAPGPDSGMTVDGGTTVPVVDGGTMVPVADGGTTKADAGSPDETDASSDAGPRYANMAHESFKVFDPDLWSCEYTCPTIEDEMALFALSPNVLPNREGSWSKARYKPQRFTAGRFTVRFSLNQRPAQKVWWGVALWDDGPRADAFNEINFGYTTDQSYGNTELRFESARRGAYVSERVDLGVNLYDGNFHEATLEYDATHVAFYFDGQLAEIITNPAVIPEDPMDFILGPRLVTGGEPLSEAFEERIDWAMLEW